MRYEIVAAIGGLAIGGLMSETRVSAGRPEEQISSARGTNPLQESFIRLEEAEQLRQQGKLDRAQRICEGLVREHPDYMVALHTLGLIYADKKNYQQSLNCLVRAAMLDSGSWST